MFTKRTSAQVVPVCVRVLTAPPILYLKSRCGLNTSWTSKLASLKLTFPDNQNVHYTARRRDDLPKEIRERARWTLLENRDWSYVIYAKEKPQLVEFINDTWYRTTWTKETGRYFMNLSQRIRHPKEFGLGTKAAPILSEVDQRRLQGVPSIEETHDGWEEGPSTRLKDEDQPIGDTWTDDELSTLIERVEMTTTEVATETAQQIAEAHIRGGGPADENPMQPSPAIASEVRTLQGQNLYGQGNLTRTDNIWSPQQTFGNRNPRGGPPGGDPPRRNPPEGGGLPGGNSPRAGSPARRDPDDDDCQRDWIHTGKISSHIDVFDGDKTKAKKFQMEFGLAQMTNPNHQNMRVPMQQVALALSYIKGEDVDEWCHRYANILVEEV